MIDLLLLGSQEAIEEACGLVQDDRKKRIFGLTIRSCSFNGLEGAAMVRGDGSTAAAP